MNKITLNVCQGVGDIFWVYQKFAPYFQAINFRICQVRGGDLPIQNRAADFLKLLPKVNGVMTKFVEGDQYEELVAGTFNMARIIDNVRAGTVGSCDYACNTPLEKGIRLESIDPAFPLEETVPIRTDEGDVPFKKYVSVYVSGGTKNPGAIGLGAWPVNTWLELINGVCDRYKLGLPLVLVGAYYDEEPLRELSEKLDRENVVLIDRPAAKVVSILKYSTLFVGYQSGLNVLADNLDVPQVMLYFPKLEKMQYAWCKKKNRDGGLFNAAIFSQKPDEIVAGLKLPL